MSDAPLTASTPDSPYRFREPAADSRGGVARKLAVIGGGLIGIEAVEVAVAAGLRPSFFIREEWFWPIALDSREAEWITNARQLTFEGRRAGEGYFSADGRRLVFQSEREPGNPFYQIYEGATEIQKMIIVGKLMRMREVY